MTPESGRRDYSLIGPESEAAIANGLAAAEWYKTDIPRKRMKEFMQRSDGPAIRDTIVWIAAFAFFGLGGYWFWGTSWAVPFFIGYGVLYGSSTDSRWHECGHGTAFKTRWMNDVVYHVACFMIMREPTVWRWSHTRHHTDTIIVGRDPEIAVMRPTDVLKVVASFFAIPQTWNAVKSMLRHAAGRLDAEEATFIPEMERGRVYLVARIWLAVHLSVIGFAVAVGSILPMMFVDHRLNSRTLYMNPVLRFIYWNMNYHIEHHMFPMVPYHLLPELHEAVKADMPRPYSGLVEAYREIIPALLHQARDPRWYVRRELPPGARPFRPELHGLSIASGA
jgi:fatty acid desaturase